ncbi:MAG TPA: hypothetical protein VHI50_03020 [Micromonosporaceae bacterium]|jgi:hypothetical protein|nr:hypothetical protein [Micromonosporaceae bacterium]
MPADYPAGGGETGDRAIEVDVSLGESWVASHTSNILTRRPLSSRPARPAPVGLNARGGSMSMPPGRGQDHGPAPEALAPVLTEFFAA